jgi:hypothetical protein
MDIYKYMDKLFYDEYEKHNYKLDYEYEDYEEYDYFDGYDEDKNRNVSTTIIPYSTLGEEDFDFELSAGPNPIVSTALGFGDEVDVTIQPNGIIFALNGSEAIIAYTMPRNGCIRSLSATITISNATEIPIGTSVTIIAQLYKAEAGSIIFNPIPGAAVLFSVITRNTPQGSSFTELNKKINYPLKEKERLALVFSATIPTVAISDFTVFTILDAGVGIL